MVLYSLFPVQLFRNAKEAKNSALIEALVYYSEMLTTEERYDSFVISPSSSDRSEYGWVSDEGVCTMNRVPQTKLTA